MVKRHLAQENAEAQQRMNVTGEHSKDSAIGVQR